MQELDFDPANEELFAQLRRIPALAALEDEQVQSVLRLSRLRRYAADETVIREGEYDHWVYFLIKGELGISHGGLPVGIIRRLGDVFGEMGVIDGSPRSATIRALAPSLCMAVDASIFDRLTGPDKCAVQALLYRVFCEVMAVRLREMDDKLAELRRRLAQPPAQP